MVSSAPASQAVGGSPRQLQQRSSAAAASPAEAQVEPGAAGRPAQAEAAAVAPGDSEQRLAALATQFQAQLAALSALSLGHIPPESTVLVACGGRVPAAATAELAEAAAAYSKRGTNGTACGSEQRGAADPAGGEQQEEPTEAERLQAAIRAKLRRLAPQQRRVRQEVLRERQLATEVDEYQLLDWRRLRRPLPAANVRAFEPPLQPAALLHQQQAARAARAAAVARVEKAALQRQHELRRGQGESGEQLPAPVPKTVNPFLRIGGPSPAPEQQQGPANGVGEERQQQALVKAEAAPEQQPGSGHKGAAAASGERWSGEPVDDPAAAGTESAGDGRAGRMRQ